MWHRRRRREGRALPGQTGPVHRHYLPLLAILAALVRPAAGQPAPGTLASPLLGACITSPFGAREDAGRHASSQHRGIDLRAPAGAWVRAVAAGRVRAIRRIGGTGLSVELALADGRVARFAHLGQVAPALAGGKREVAQGDVLGRVGRSGITYGAHLHFELLAGGVPIDPEPLLGIARCG